MITFPSPLTFQRSKPRSSGQHFYISFIVKQFQNFRRGEFCLHLSQRLDVCDIPSYSHLYFKADTQGRPVSAVVIDLN